MMLLPLLAGSVSAVCLDLAYLPSGSAASTVDVEFFRRLRSSCYIISGDEPHKKTAMRSILDSLLEGKACWPDVQVTSCFIYSSPFPSSRCFTKGVEHTAILHKKQNLLNNLQHCFIWLNGWFKLIGIVLMRFPHPDSVSSLHRLTVR